MTSFKLVVRNLIRDRLYTSINILGLSLGLSCAIIIMVWVKNELSFDKYLPDHDRVYRLTFESNWGGTGKSHFARCWEWWVSQIPSNFPQVEELVRVCPNRHTAVKNGDTKVFVDQFFVTDSNIFKAFGIQLLSGDPNCILNEPRTVVLSETLSHKLFGNSNPVGQVIMVAGDSLMIANTVKGVFKDLPFNSHVHFELLQSFNDPKINPGWAYIYLKLKKGTSPTEVLEGMPAFIKKFEKEENARNFKPFLQRVTDIHLYSNKDREIESNGDIAGVYLFILVAFIVLLVAWVDYYNLNHVRLFKLSKQVSIQAIHGSGYARLIGQGVVESFICTTVAILSCLVFSEWFNRLLSPLIGFNLLPAGGRNLGSIWFFIILVFVFTVLIGCLPLLLHLVKTRYYGIRLSEKRKSAKHWVFSVRGVLVIAQFVLAIVLIFSTLVIFKQKQFLLNYSMGNMNDDIILINNDNWQTRSIYSIYKQRALDNPLIKDFTSSMEKPSGETMDRFEIESQGIKNTMEKNSLFILPVEDNFLQFFNLKVIAGNDFRPYNDKSKRQDYILNETAVKLLGWTPEEAVGKPFKLKFICPDMFYEGTIIGVVQDFHFNTLKQQIKPYAFMQQHVFQTNYLIKIDTAHHAEAIQYLNKLWSELAPDYPFEYTYLSDTYRKVYQKELMQTQLTGLFTLFTIVIVCLGLFAITSIIIAQRTKEIGIRKVNGASVAEITGLLLKNVLIWIGLASVIALPIAFYLMDRWLQSFVYRTSINWSLFAIASSIAFFIGVTTVLYQAWRAATRNPVEALRYE